MHKFMVLFQFSGHCLANLIIRTTAGKSATSANRASHDDDKDFVNSVFCAKLR